MIRILNRYIAKTILQSTVLTALILCSVLFFILMLTEFKDIGEGDFGLMQLILYVVLRLPNELYHLSPLFILLGTIIGLSILSSHKELAVMRASGFSMQQIIISVMGAAFLLTLLVSGISEWLAPGLSYQAAVQRENARNSGQAVVTSSGVWLHVDNNFIHIEQIIDRQSLEGVTRYQFDDRHHLQAAYYAKYLSYDNHQWVMREGVKTLFYPERTQSFRFDQAPWDLKFNANLFNFGLVDPREMSLSKLAKFSTYLKKNGLQAAEYQYEFWQRIFQPFASLVMILLALPIVLNAFSTTPLGWRVVAGTLIGFVFYILNALLGQLCVVFQLPAIFAASLPLIGFALLGLFLSNWMIRR